MVAPAPETLDTAAPDAGLSPLEILQHRARS
jgi:hypothetical protein